jgi:hypothetical protein
MALRHASILFFWNKSIHAGGLLFSVTAKLDTTQALRRLTEHHPSRVLRVQELLFLFLEKLPQICENQVPGYKAVEVCRDILLNVRLALLLQRTVRLWQ